MKKLICKEKGVLEIVECPIPEIQDDELLLKLRLCGICGTDMIKVYDNHSGKEIVLGHELVGTVEKIGNKVTKYKTGDRVVALHHVPDYSSHFTRRNSGTKDPSFPSTNIYPCGFAEYIRVSSLHIQHALGLVPDFMADERAVFMEPLTCVLRSLERVSFQASDRTALIGAGNIGIIFIPLLKSLHTSIIACDISDERLSLCRSFGVDDTFNIMKSESKKMQDYEYYYKSCDTVVVTVVNPQSIELALDLVREGGTILIFGAKKGTIIPLDLGKLFYREVNIVTSYGSTPDLLPKAMKILEDDKFCLENTISHKIPLTQADEGFKLLQERKASKIVISCK